MESCDSPRRDGRLGAAPPKDEEREPDEHEVEGRVGCFAARQVETGSAHLQRNTTGGRQHGQVRFDACERRQEHAEPAQHVDDGREVEEAGGDLAHPWHHLCDFIDGRGELPEAATKKRQPKQALGDKKGDVQRSVGRRAGGGFLSHGSWSPFSLLGERAPAAGYGMDRRCC